MGCTVPGFYYFTLLDGAEQPRGCGAQGRVHARVTTEVLTSLSLDFPLGLAPLLME